LSKKVAYPELEAALARKGIRKKEVSDLLGIVQRTLSKKLSGENYFTLDEAFAIQKEWFADILIETLFRKE
jgi:hypothetical protein